jgi:hypothetical protein
MSIKGLAMTLLVGLVGAVVSRGIAHGSAVSGKQPAKRGGGAAQLVLTGPDVIVSRVGLSAFGTSDYWYWGQNDDIVTFSGSTTSCNIGDAAAEWIGSPDPRHPIITQNLYRYLDGRFEQVGIAWAKHGFCAVNEPSCGTCEETDCESLGVGCADTYFGFMNGDANRLGPRAQVNPRGDAISGTNVQPHATPTGDHLGRLAIAAADLAVPNARYVFEAQYVLHDEAPDQRDNNVSWREVSTTLDALTNVDTTRTEQPGIYAWAEFESGVTVETVAVPNDGIFHVAWKVTDNGDGTWRYEYAVQNQSVHRAAQSISVPVPECVDITSLGFHDIDYHSGDGEGLAGENYNDTDWPAQIGASSVAWATTPYASDPNANALRWATIYNFRFDASTPPTAATMTIDLFRPGGTGDPAAVSVAVEGPATPLPCAADCSALPGCGDGLVNVVDLLFLLGQWGVDGTCDVSGDGTINVVDLLAVLSAWGACP